MSDYWIGDYVLIKSKGLNGKYHGESSGDNAWVKVGEEIISVSLSDLAIAKEPERDSFQAPSHKNFQKKKKNQLAAREIDLHLEKLDPKGTVSQHRMLDFQIDACKTFIEKAIEARYRTVLIIHGKGAGLLKGEILHLLASSNEVEYTFEKNKGGATEVWLKI